MIVFLDVDAACGVDDGLEAANVLVFDVERGREGGGEVAGCEFGGGTYVDDVGLWGWGGHFFGGCVLCGDGVGKREGSLVGCGGSLVGSRVRDRDSTLVKMILYVNCTIELRIFTINSSQYLFNTFMWLETGLVA